MLKAFSLAVLCLSAAPQAPEPEPLSRLLPPPLWIADKAEALNVAPEVRQAMQAEWDLEREAYDEARRQARRVRLRFADGLQEDHLDQDGSMAVFEEMLSAENEMKRIQARVRLSALGHLTTQQRREARAAMGPRTRPPLLLKRRIEEVRALGRRIRRRGGDNRIYLEEMLEVSRLIESGDTDLALEIANQVLADMRSALER